MKRQSLSALVLAASRLVVAQQGCRYLSEIQVPADPFQQLAPGSYTLPCDYGGAVPLGKIPTGCSQLEIVVARGTSELGELGMIVGDPLVARVKRDLKGVNVRGYPVQWEATSTDTTKAIADVQRRLKEQVKECPNEKFVLVGYTRGAFVIQMAARQLSAEIRNKIIAVVLFAGGNGSGVVDPLKPKLLVNCAPGDGNCPGSEVGAGLFSYNNNGTRWHDRSAEYIASAFNGNPLGPKFAKSPTGAL